MELDPKGISQLLIMQEPDTLYWTSGPWDGHSFSFVPEMGSNYILNFSYTYNQEETYFTYNRQCNSTSRLVMDLSGQIQQLYWLESTQQWNLLWSEPRTQCEVYAFCGAFGCCNQQTLPFCSCIQGFEPRSSGHWELSDYTAGCARKTPLQCENNNQTTGEPDEFVMLSNVQLPVNPISFESRIIEECKSACLSNCSRTGCAFNDYNCSIWIGDLINLQHLTDDDHSARDFYVKVATPMQSPKRNKRKLWIIVVLAISLTAISSAAFIWWMWV
ncbi:G-type lectin S-receptor-like serine/threonine-protein kinase At2g19130 [Quercus lobata]|nr:G-type lectin S-receptor-like serine/threonine-protein kinase At2g19130 [Quercus lobata]